MLLGQKSHKAGWVWRPFFCFLLATYWANVAFSDVIDSIYLNAAAGDDEFADVTIVFEPLYGTIQEKLISNSESHNSDCSLDYYAALWLRADTQKNFSVSYELPSHRNHTVDFRDAYLECSGGWYEARVGKNVASLGFNTLINPSDFSPLDFYDPLHPNRMGVWGTSMSASGFNLMMFRNQGSIFAEHGIYRPIPNDLEVESFVYSSRLGVSLAYTGEFELGRYQFNYYNGTSNIPLLAYDGNSNFGRWEALFTDVSMISNAVEFSLEELNIRHEIAYVSDDAAQSYAWGALEVDRTLLLGADDRSLVLTAGVAYTSSSREFLSYDSFRKNSAVVVSKYDITANRRYQWLQELGVGTSDSGYFVKSSIRYTPSSLVSIDVYVQRIDLEGEFEEGDLLFGMQLVLRPEF